MKYIIKRSGKILFIAYALIILVLHVIPIGSGDINALNQIEIGILRFDYILHALVFVPWAVIIRLVYGINFWEVSGKAFLWLFAGILFAATAEYIQYFLPYRSFNIYDVMGNVTGVIIGASVFFWKKDYITKRIYNHMQNSGRESHAKKIHAKSQGRKGKNHK